LSSIAIKYTLIDIVVFDCIPFPIFTHTHTTGMTHFLAKQMVDVYENAVLGNTYTRLLGN